MNWRARTGMLPERRQHGTQVAHKGNAGPPRRRGGMLIAGKWEGDSCKGTTTTTKIPDWYVTAATRGNTCCGHDRAATGLLSLVPERSQEKQAIECNGASAGSRTVAFQVNAHRKKRSNAGGMFLHAATYKGEHKNMNPGGNPNKSRLQAPWAQAPGQQGGRSGARGAAIEATGPLCRGAPRHWRAGRVGTSELRGQKSHKPQIIACNRRMSKCRARAALTSLDDVEAGRVTHTRAAMGMDTNHTGLLLPAPVPELQGQHVDARQTAKRWTEHEPMLEHGGGAGDPWVPETLVPWGPAIPRWVHARTQQAAIPRAGRTQRTH